MKSQVGSFNKKAADKQLSCADTDVFQAEMFGDGDVPVRYRSSQLTARFDSRSQLLRFRGCERVGRNAAFKVIFICVIVIAVFKGYTMNKTLHGLSPGDPNSYSKPDEAAVTHIHLSLNVDFEKKVLSGHSELTVLKKVGSQLILDSRDLVIKSITDTKSGQSLKHNVENPVLTFGSKLNINLPENNEEKYVIKIVYETSPSSSALQWLTPEQTAGGKHPYLFSQCEAIHCRSLMPCQDTPSVKTTYSADVTAPSDLVVLMSAIREGEPENLTDGKKTHKFRQSVPIPSYLLAIAVGPLVSRKIGPRSHVWSEKEYIEKAEYEFAETEQMLATAEEICGPYVWGIYDLLVLPPSFPFGGMENPCLTFVTPTLLAGDRSLADVVAHEISHSWTGNLVTNRNFQHFWLNEGFTMFVERKILGRMHGNASRHFSAIGGLKDLADTIKSRGEDDPLTCLVPDLKGIDPDDSFSTVPYEKGHTFLFYLEDLLGGPAVFDPFLKSYLNEFKFKSLDTDDFKKFLYQYFSKKTSLLNQVDWQAWLYTPGMPIIIPEYDTSLADACTTLAGLWRDWSGDFDSPFRSTDLQKLSSLQVREFLAQLLEFEPFSVKKVQAMQAAYNFNEVVNCEIRFRWLRLCIKAQWSDQINRALAFVTEQGRMKYVRPIYRDLYAWPEARAQAVEVFKAHRANMMYVSAYTVAKDLHITSD